MRLRIIVITVIFVLSILWTVDESLCQSGIEQAPAVENIEDTDSFLKQEFSSMPDFTSMILKGLFSLSLVVVLIFGFVLFLRKFVYKRNGMPLSGELIKVINTTFIAPKKSIHLVKIMDRVIVVGVTESQMQSLAEFKGDEIPETMIENVSKINNPNNFSKYFTSFLNKMKKSEQREMSHDESR